MFNQTNKNVQSSQKYKLLAIYQKKQWEKHNVTKQISHAFFFTRVSFGVRWTLCEFWGKRTILFLKQTLEQKLPRLA